MIGTGILKIREFSAILDFSPVPYLSFETGNV